MNGDDAIQAQRCADLLKAVITQAAIDLATQPHGIEKRHQRNLDRNARASLRFFMTPRSPLEIYAAALNIDADTFRRGVQELDRRPVPQFGEMERRTVQLRVRWWAAEMFACHGVPDDAEEIAADDQADTQPGELEVRA